MATKTYVQFIRDAQTKGYFVTLVYFWLNSPELAIERVKIRVSSGGHNIPEETIRRRYKAGIENLSKLYIPKFDSVKMMREIRDKVSSDIKNMTPERILEYIKNGHNDFEKIMTKK